MELRRPESGDVAQAERSPVLVPVTGLPVELADVLSAIVSERRRQVAKFGDQAGCPDADPVLLARLGREADLGDLATPASVAGRLAAHYEVPTEIRAHQTCEGERAEGSYTWFGIVLEEVCEVLDAIPRAVAANEPATLLAEVEQCAAVFVAWSEALRRRGVQATVGGA